MSEYQYYEFQAIDRPLTDKEMSELRGHSTRARITATSFINHYDWGSFKGDPDKWMEKYFDAFLYFANWGTCEIKLRLPSTLLSSTTARMYCHGESASVREKNGKVVVSLISQDEDRGWAEDQPSLSTLLGVRAELADGDLRSLYLGWLLQVQSGELRDKNTEPPVPPGLGELSASLAGLADFLCIDCDLLHVAAQASVPLRSADVNQEKVRSWVAQLGGEEKNDLLIRLIIEGSKADIRELRQRYIKEHTAGNVEMQVPRRTVGELLKLAEAQAQERQRIEAEKRARAKERKERESAIARAEHLDSITGRESELWNKIEALLAMKQPKSYDTAINILVDLRDLDTRNKQDGFQLRLKALGQAHINKTSFIKRLEKQGLSWR